MIYRFLLNFKVNKLESEKTKTLLKMMATVTKITVSDFN